MVILYKRGAERRDYENGIIKLRARKSQGPIQLVATLLVLTIEHYILTRRFAPRLPQDVFRSSDMDSIACVLARKAVDELGFVGAVESSTFAGLGSSSSSKGSLLKARELLITECVKILACYRKNTVASQSPKGQLILPETLKLLPLFILSMLKSTAVRSSVPRNRTNRNAPPSPRGAY